MTDHSSAVKSLTRLMGGLGLYFSYYVGPLTWLLTIKMRAETGGDVFGVWKRVAEAPYGEQGPELERVLSAHKPDHRPLSPSRMVFAGAHNPFGNGATLEKVLKVIGGRNWTGGRAEAMGEVYEELLHQGAREVRGGLGQYFTPRPVAEALAACVAPAAGNVVHDPACGTGGFLLAAHRAQPEARLSGVEVERWTARLAQANLNLHRACDPTGSPAVAVADALQEPGPVADVVVANPPFGKAPAGLPVRPDWWAPTSSKHLGFWQHVALQLAPGGRAAVILPDSALFEEGAAATIRRRLLDPGGLFHLHTLLRLPEGIFHATGVRTTAVLFDRARRVDDPTGLWVYDLRTGADFSAKRNPIGRADLEGFVAGFDRRGEGDQTARWRRYELAELAAAPGAGLDLSWDAGEGPAELADPLAIIGEIEDSLRESLSVMRELRRDLSQVRAEPDERGPEPRPAPEDLPAGEDTPHGRQFLIPLDGEA